MLVTDIAYRDMEAQAHDLVDRLGLVVRWLFRRPGVTVSAANSPYQLASEHRAHLRLTAQHDEENLPEEPDGPGAITAFRWRRHPQLLNQVETGPPADAEDLERGARSAAVRGLFLARSGRIEEARSVFAIAAAEPSVDLAAIPGFWDLSRSGMLAAVGAYDDVERFREASALGARIRLTYRPRSVSAVPEAPKRRRSAAGS